MGLGARDRNVNTSRGLQSTQVDTGECAGPEEAGGGGGGGGRAPGFQKCVPITTRLRFVKAPLSPGLPSWAAGGDPGRGTRPAVARDPRLSR